jgi:hypothetical protein
MIVAVAVANAEELACAVATIVTFVGLGALAGAVYKPADVIVPQAAPVQPEPLTLHVTAVFLVPATVARNCC